MEYKWTTKRTVCVLCELIIKRQKDLMENISSILEHTGAHGCPDWGVATLRRAPDCHRRY